MAALKHLVDVIDVNGNEVKIVSKDLDSNFKYGGYVTKVFTGDEADPVFQKVLYTSASWDDVKVFHKMVIRAVKDSATANGSNLYFFAEGLIDLFKFILTMKSSANV